VVTEPRSGGGFQHIPRPALVLGFAGLLPFLASALAAWLVDDRLFAVAVNLKVAYGAVILSFLGAVHWGLALAQGDAANWRRLGLSVLPALAGWLALVISLPLGLLLLAVGFVAVFFADLRTVAAGRAPSWYKTLRKALTLIVLLSLAASYAALMARL